MAVGQDEKWWTYWDLTGQYMIIGDKHVITSLIGLWLSKLCVLIVSVDQSESKKSLCKLQLLLWKNMTRP